MSELLYIVRSNDDFMRNRLSKIRRRSTRTQVLVRILLLSIIFLLLSSEIYTQVVEKTGSVSGRIRMTHFGVMKSVPITAVSDTSRL